MKRILVAVAVAITAVAFPVLAADMAVSVNVGHPGFYGRLDVGGFPPPQVIYRQPVMIERAPVGRSPVYLRVPPGHAKNWRKHCHRYDACGEQVYFVKDRWYSNEYVPRYQERYSERREGYRDEHRDNGRREHHRDSGPGR